MGLNGPLVCQQADKNLTILDRGKCEAKVYEDRPFREQKGAWHAEIQCKSWRKKRGDARIAWRQVVSYLSPKGRYWILKSQNTFELLGAGTKTFHSVGAHLISLIADDKETCAPEVSAFYSLALRKPLSMKLKLNKHAVENMG